MLDINAATKRDSKGFVLRRVYIPKHSYIEAGRLNDDTRSTPNVCTGAFSRARRHILGIVFRRYRVDERDFSLGVTARLSSYALLLRAGRAEVMYDGNRVAFVA